jgi:hypothetical protein
MPLVEPRARFRIIEPRTRHLLDTLRLVPADAQRGEDDLLVATQGTSARLSGAALTHQLIAPFQAALEERRPQIEASGAGLDLAIEKTSLSVERAIAKLTAKYERALLHRDQNIVENVRELKRRLYPDGVPQERVFGLASFAARWGNRAFVERILAALIPFDPEIQDLDWPEAAGQQAAEAGS